ncbi:MAG: hypothetical protein ACJ71E_09675 [Nitrososphaeraceae archaeon]
MLIEINFGLPNTRFNAYSNVPIDLKLVSAYNFSAVPGTSIMNINGLVLPFIY